MTVTADMEAARKSNKMQLATIKKIQQDDFVMKKQEEELSKSIEALKLRRSSNAEQLTFARKSFQANQKKIDAATKIIKAISNTQK